MADLRRGAGRDQIQHGRDDEVESEQLGALEPVGVARRRNGCSEKHCAEQHPHLSLGEDQLELRLSDERRRQHQEGRDEESDLHAASEGDANAEVDPIGPAHGDG